jgi:fatty-acyl-CoA synthase
MLTQEQVQGRVRQQYVALAPRSASAPPLKNGETIHAGWLHTGDLVQLSDDGAMKLVDRLKDVIITGGRNVYSAEVEQALAGHPDITDCAVIGRPHPEWGETIVVVVPPNERHQPDLESLREYCRSRLADYKLPREMHIAPIPRTPAARSRNT